jgi:hypothetical protein
VNVLRQFSPGQLISLAVAIVVIAIFFALQIEWVAALFD